MLWYCPLFLKRGVDILTNKIKKNKKKPDSLKLTQTKQRRYLLHKAKNNGNAYYLTRSSTQICIMSPRALCGKKITQKFYIT